MGLFQRGRYWLVFAGALLMAGALAQADQLFVQGMNAQQVTFVDFVDGKLVYTTRGGERTDRDIARVSHIAVDGEVAFNEAEVAFAKDDKPKAIDGYTKAIRATSKPWLRTFAARRLLIALGDSDRFDAKLVAYLALLQASPEDALQFKPALPEKGNKQIDTGIADIETALKLPNLGGPQQLGMYTLLVDLHRRKGDEAAATATLERLAKVADQLGDLPEIREQLAAARVAQARLALDQKKYAEATKLIEDNRASISDPRLQSDALYTLAAAKRAEVKPTDTAAMKDTALMFMRIVAHFGDMEGKPNVLPSLVATAEILEKIGDKPAAISVLEQITKEFPNDPASKKAADDIKRLQPAN